MTKEVYDQDGDGLVSMEEFIGCQTILQNSLGLKSKASLGCLSVSIPKS